MKDNFYNESIDSMKSIVVGAKDRGWSYLNIIQLIWTAFDFNNDYKMRLFFKNWIVDKEREINE